MLSSTSECKEITPAKLLRLTLIVMVVILQLILQEIPTLTYSGSFSCCVANDSVNIPWHIARLKLVQNYSYTMHIINVFILTSVIEVILPITFIGGNGSSAYAFSQPSLQCGPQSSIPFYWSL